MFFQNFLFRRVTLWRHSERLTPFVIPSVLPLSSFRRSVATVGISRNEYA